MILLQETDKYSASLGHKANHSFSSNCELLVSVSACEQNLRLVVGVAAVRASSVWTLALCESAE